MHMLWRAGAAIGRPRIVVLAAGGPSLASDFLTEGVDSGRTGWVRDEKVFTTANVGSTKLLWKLKLDSTPRAMHNLFAPLVAERVATAQGTRELAVVAGVSDDLFGIDVASGPADLASPLRQHARESGRHERHALPGRANRRADDGADVAGQVHGVRGVVGRPSPAGESRRRRGRRRRRRSSSRVAANRTRSTCTTASSTRRRRRAAAASPMRSTRSISPRGVPARSSRQAVDCGDAAARPSIPKAGCSSERATRSSIR